MQGVLLGVCVRCVCGDIIQSHCYVAKISEGHLMEHRHSRIDKCVCGVCEVCA